MENMTLNYKEFCNVCFALLQAKDEMKDFKLKLENNDCGDICVHAIVELDAKTSADAYFYLTDYYRNTYLVNKTSVRDIVDCLAKLILGSFKEYKDEMKLDKKLGFEEFMKELTTCLQANPQLFEFTFERDKEDDYILNVFAKIPGDTARNCLDIGRLYTDEYLENGKSLKDIVVFLSDTLFHSFQEYKKSFSTGDKLGDTLEKSLHESITVYIKDRIAHGEDPDEIFKDCQKKIFDNYEEMANAGLPLVKEDADALVTDVYNVIEQLKTEESHKIKCCHHSEPEKCNNYNSLQQNIVDNFIKRIKAVVQQSIDSGVPGDVIMKSFDDAVILLTEQFEDFNQEAIDIKNARLEIAKMIDERDKVEETFKEIIHKELNAIRSDAKKLLDDGVDGKTVLARFDRVGDAVTSLFAAMGDTEDIRKKGYYKDLRDDIIKMCEEKDKAKENAPVTNSDLTDKVTEDAIKSFVESLNRNRRKR